MKTKNWIDSFGGIVPDSSPDKAHQLTLTGEYRTAPHDLAKYWYTVQPPAIVTEILVDEMFENDINEWKKLSNEQK